MEVFSSHPYSPVGLGGAWSSESEVCLLEPDDGRFV